MSVTIEVDGTDYDVPSSAADANWAAQQVAFEQAVATYLGEVGTESAATTADLATLSAAVKPTAVVGTAGTGLTSTSTSYGRNVVHKATLGHALVAAAGDVASAEFIIWTVPAKTRILRVIADVTTPFGGGGISAILMKVGISSAGDQLLKEADVFTAPIVIGNSQAELGAGIVGGTGFDSDILWSGTAPVQCILTADDAHLLEVDAGSMTFYIECCTYP